MTTATCCVICLDPISEPCETQPCHHANFDYLCLLSWLQRSTACPLCKTTIAQVRHGGPGDGSDESEQITLRVSELNLGNASVTPIPTSPRRRRARRSYPPTSPIPHDSALQRRREVYTKQLYSLRVGSNPISGYRELSPALMSREPQLVSRARAFLRRELSVFRFLSHGRTSNAEYLVEYMVAILKSLDTQGSQGAAEDMVAEFLGRQNARLLLHELRSWLRSPYKTLGEWDRVVQYPSPGLGG